MSQTTIEENSLELLSSQLAQAQQLFDRQRDRVDDLRFELDEAAIARDKALYYLLRLCEAAEREQWAISDEVQQFIEPALNLLFDHNIYTGLPEPDAAILRLMEIVSIDLEQAQDTDTEGETI